MEVYGLANIKSAKKRILVTETRAARNKSIRSAVKTSIKKVEAAVAANDKAAALQNLFNEIYIRDITRRNRVKNIGELEDLLNILSSAIGSLTNPEKLKNTFKTVKKSRITSATIKKYLDCFEDSFLIESAQRYDIKGKAYIETPKKYYYGL